MRARSHLGGNVLLAGVHGFGIIIENLTLLAFRKVGTRLYFMHAVRKCIVPMRNIRSIYKVFVANVLQRLGQESFLCFNAEIYRTLLHHLAWQSFQVGSFYMPSQFPVLIHPVEPIRQPRAPNLEKCHRQSRKSLWNALKENTCKLLKNADWESYSVHFSKGFEHSRGKLLSPFAGTMNSEQTSEALSFFIDRIVKPMAKR